MNDQRSIHDRIMTVDRPHSGTNKPAAFVSRRRRLILAGIAAACLIVAAGGALFVYNDPDWLSAVAQAAGLKQTAQPVAPVPEQIPAGNEADEQSAINASLFLTHAAGAGVSTCAATYAGLGKALTEGTRYMMQTQTATTEANLHSIQGMVGMTFHSEKSYSGPAAGLVFAAPVGSSCEGHMVRIVPFPENCSTAASFLPEGSSAQTPLNDIAVIALPAGGQAMLMPAGTGCIAIFILRSEG